MSRRVFRASVAGLLIGGLLACGGGGDPGPVMSVDSTGASTFDSASLASQLATYPLAQLSGAEADSLVFMR
ncbi:MAG: phosphoesterase, partial [Burkholderiaceae bacterium]|nr:phosphoesterase [Burkholderiaceae bacterium]